MKSKFIYPLILFVLIIPAFWFLLKPGIYWNMHDDMQLIRQMEMEKCLKDGQIPCRWTPDLGYGYGYPLFNFYPPLPYYVGQVYREIGFSFVETIKYTAILQFVFSAFAMYLLASSLFGPIGGLLSALFYTYAPYHALNIYVRGAMNEAWASVFFPLILYFSKKYIDQKHPSSLIFLSISFSFLMLSHNPMVLIFAPITLLWSIYWILQQKTKLWFSIIRNLSFSALLAFGLSAYFTLPVIFESKLVQIESMFTNYYHFSIHFASLKQLFISNFWGEGPSVWGTNDGMSFAIGYLQWIIPFSISAYILFKLVISHKLSKLEIITFLTILCGLFTTFLSHERSTFIWLLITPLQKIQFPWRLLNITTFLFSFSVGYLGYLIAKTNTKIRSLSILIIVSLLIALNISHFTPVKSGPITDSQKFSGVAWTNQVTGGIYDYLPKTASTAAKAPAKEYLDEISPANTKYLLTGQKKGTDWMFFNINLSSPASIYLPLLGFPKFSLNVDGQKHDYEIEPLLGRISITLDSGQHQIYIKLTNTPIRNIGNSITVLALLITVSSLYIIWKKKN